MFRTRPRRHTTSKQKRPWYHDIGEYLKKGIYPQGATENDKRMLRRLVVGFFLSAMILYRKSADLTLLCCVDDQEAQEILEEVHEGTFGTHVNGHAFELATISRRWSRTVSSMPECRERLGPTGTSRPVQRSWSSRHQ
ncbi:hypothetical protein CR513_47425, partial [Mucuna pruriens]